MTVSELYTSRELHITKEGQTLTQVHTCSDADWNAGGDGITTLPKIGDLWNDERPDLIATDIRMYWLNNKNARVETTYSTLGFIFPENQPDKMSSTRESFDFSFTPIQLTGEDAFWDYNAGAAKTWASVYNATYAGEPVSQLPRIQPQVVFTQKMNVSVWSWNRIRDSFAKVNDADFIVQWQTNRTKGPEYFDSTGDDTGKWLFMGFTADKVGDSNSEIVLTFLYNGEGWNTPYGLSNIYLYQTANFNLLPFPEDEDDFIEVGLR